MNSVHIYCHGNEVWKLLTNREGGCVNCPSYPSLGQGGTPSLGNGQNKGQLKDMQSGNIASDELQISCSYYEYKDDRSCPSCGDGNISEQPFKRFLDKTVQILRNKNFFTLVPSAHIPCGHHLQPKQSVLWEFEGIPRWEIPIKYKNQLFSFPSPGIHEGTRVHFDHRELSCNSDASHQGVHKRRQPDH